ncbi:TetR family transcriptional regulator [Gorillibacterium massiliense]|uniref:TetR family transcriptional regulator n=1 Tax=Gorillibacterium massiliense TaxID=1280390 RepID=UPI0004AC752A|nr:TetR family transcriptional regulator [Gorillibacterium massiliense]
MNGIEQSTKEKILVAALDMFSVDGYTAVSIRDIGKAVGIKESSIYYHFRNKEDIFQTLLDQAEQLAQIRKDSFNNELYVVSKIVCEKFINAGIAYIEGYLLEAKIHKLIRMLLIEKQRNENAAIIYHKLLFVAPLEHHKNVFTFMIDKGYIHEDHPDFLAAEYQSIILYVFQKYFSGPGAVADDAKSAAKKELTLMLKRFFTHYFCMEA